MTGQEPQSCLFCRIVSGDLPSHGVYEDDLVSAFLDIHPVGLGHTLVVPKRHFENVRDIPADLLAHVHQVAKRVAEAQIGALNPAGISIAQNNGAAAGQIIFHLHVHVIPKSGQEQQRADMSDDDLAAVAQRLREAMGG